MTPKNPDQTPAPADEPRGEGQDEPAPEAATPHDALFHFAFADPKHAAAELQCVLPKDLSARIDWPSLTPEPGRFVDAKLSSRYSDLLFSARIGRRRSLIYLLFEHLSSRKRMSLLKMLEYMVRIWREHVKKHPRAKRLPFILPVVLHHSEAGWTMARRFRDLLDIDPEVLELLEPFVPDFHVLLDDISRVDPEKLKTRAMTPEGKLVLFCFRLARTPDELVKRLPEWVDVLVAVAKGPNGGLFISATMRYLEVVAKLSATELKMAMQQARGDSVAESIIFAGERAIERGRREGEIAGRREGEIAGRREGELAGQRALLLRQLDARFGALPKDATKRIQAATASEVEAMAMRVLTAATLDEVLTKKKRR